MKKYYENQSYFKENASTDTNPHISFEEKKENSRSSYSEVNNQSSEYYTQRFAKAKKIGHVSKQN